MDPPAPRRIAVSLALLVAATGLFPLVAPAAEEVADDGASLATQASRHAAERALAWLAEHQEDDGAWRCDVGFKLNESYKVERVNVPHVGVTALAGTALLASGSVPGRGPYADHVERAVDFVIRAQSPAGYVSREGTRMYEHAFATLFLAEVYGMTHDPRVRAALQRAVEFTYKSQNAQGGWRYVPNAEDSDMSIVVCQVVALRAAKNKGITVPKESIDKAVDYVLNSANTGGRRQLWGEGFEPGTFLYQYDPRNQHAEIHSRTSFALTSAGLTTLYGAGIYTDQDIRDFVAKRRLEKYVVRKEPMPSFRDMLGYVRGHYDDVANSQYYDHYFFYYGNYYAAQAMFITGGRYWDAYYSRLREDLLEIQRPDGSFDSIVGPAFSTAIGALLLSVPNNYLPIFQR